MNTVDKEDNVIDCMRDHYQEQCIYVYIQVIKMMMKMRMIIIIMYMIFFPFQHY